MGGRLIIITNSVLAFSHLWRALSRIFRMVLLHFNKLSQVMNKSLLFHCFLNDLSQCELLPWNILSLVLLEQRPQTLRQILRNFWALVMTP